MTIFLPNKTEGFYLPALEGMAMETLVICPDCIGNRSFCLPGFNCLRPDYAKDAIIEAVKTAVELSSEKAELLLSNASETATNHTLQNERASFLGILDIVDELW